MQRNHLHGIYTLDSVSDPGVTYSTQVDVYGPYTDTTLLHEGLDTCRVWHP